ADSGANFRLVYDTFHHYLGPDDARAIERYLDISLVGMVHASGVRRDRLQPDLRDEDRGLVDPDDAIGNREQIARLRQLGYAGPVSLEPFAPDLAELSRAELVPELERSLRLLEANEAAS
ncbi:MAG: TIM barrel protein, partial [Spirochaetaceae bacterium]|nr:TIM barrel protein [Spirochaetaceae bacterium]